MYNPATPKSVKSNATAEWTKLEDITTPKAEITTNAAIPRKTSSPII